MMNVYGRLDVFYKEHAGVSRILAKDLAEKFLRRTAWQGADEEILNLQWTVIAECILYMKKIQLFDFVSLTSHDYQEIFYRLIEDEKIFLPNESQAVLFFDLIGNFYAYLKRLGYVDIAPYLQEAKNSFYESDGFVMPKRRPENDFYASLEHMDEITAEDMEVLNEILDVLLQKIGEYFRQPQFLADLTRAVTLFEGPNVAMKQGEDLTAEQEAFWFSFWDYFLFDYHLIQTDKRPLAYYYEHEKKHLNSTEIDIIKDLLKARFTVFYIESIEDNYVFCKDIFTDDIIELPVPESFIADYKKVILYGHIHAHGVMLLNYITSVPASEKLRHRIKDEILYQYDLFKYQQPEAAMSDFLGRQAASVRHVIRILTEFAQLRVLPMRTYPKPIDSSDFPRDSYAAAETRLCRAAKRLGFSFYATGLLVKMYEDFLVISDISDASKRRVSTLTAILFVFAKINGIEMVDLKNIINHFGAKHEAIFLMVSEIQNNLRCILYDPRYITEEGSVQALYMESV